MQIGFVGLGNVGGKLAGSLLRNGASLIVSDLDAEKVSEFTARGAGSSAVPADLARQCGIVITCLPNPQASASVVEGPDGLLKGFRRDAVWCEMSTTDEREVQRLGKAFSAIGAHAVDCPVSGGCHRAATGNISIFAGCDRPVFERILPLLTMMGRRILHTGRLGSASQLKVLTNYLATANLVSVCEALTTATKAGLDMKTTYEAIRISSGNSFVHETEGQVILNGSRDISFTMDLVVKDLSLFSELAERSGVNLDLAPMLLEIFHDAEERYGAREWSPNLIRRLEDATGCRVSAPGFPAEIEDDEPEIPGYEGTMNTPRA